MYMQKDDMAPLLEKMRLADITVYATRSTSSR
jgi:multimeric flavodoxin WrbA